MNCIFGIFDVLGFKSFCENCDPNDAKEVLKIMDDFETEIPNIVMDALDIQKTVPSERRKIVLDRLHWLTFSDTVFVAMPYDLSEHPEKLKFDLIFFTILVIHINRRMFEIGLPMRGAIHVGDVTVSKRCFAGKAIVDAYRLSEKFQVAATVVSEQAEEVILKKVFSEARDFYYFFKNSIIESKVPTGIKEISELISSNTSEKTKTLCWLFFKMGNIHPFSIPSNLNAYITGRFAAHGKKLSGYKEQLKVVNTEKLFNDWRTANHAQGFNEIILPNDKILISLESG